jgi:GT2 family glycosyltransferase
MKSKPDLSAGVVICTRHRLEPLLICLHSIKQQSFPITQIIIVDSSNIPINQETAFSDMFSNINFPQTDRIFIHSQPGLTFQRNQGISQASTDIVFFFDDDLILSSTYVDLLMTVFISSPHYGGGMGQIIQNLQRQKRGGDLFRRVFLLQQARREGKLLPSGLPTYPHGHALFKEVEILSGGMAAYSLSVLRENKFDEYFTGYAYMEDVEYSYRVSRKHKLFYEPKAIAEHRHSPIARDQIADNRKMYLVNHHYIFNKHLFPRCKMCLFPYLWAILGLLLQSLWLRQWQALAGYIQGIKGLVNTIRRETDALSRG